MKEDRAPRFVFLGFCDRAETITKGHQALWHQNILGLSRSRLFYILPVNLRGQKIATAVFRPCAGDQFKLVFRCAPRNRQFDFTIGISSVTEARRTSETAPAETKELLEGGDGWVLNVAPLDFDVFVFEGGVYDVYLSTESGEDRLGDVVLSNAEVPQFTPEEVAAIKSNPFGMKVVRVEFKCVLCGESLRAYAGLESNTKLEGEGWKRNTDLLDDRFRCTCGVNDFSLEPIRKGLHGFLRASFDKVTQGPVFSSIRMYEDSVLAEHCRQFSELINSNPKEEKIQTFLESHEIFFSTFAPRRLMVKPRVLANYFADFAILNERSELLLVEIERPGMLLLRRDGVITADLQRAFSQVQDWFRVFHDHRAAALDILGLRLADVANVRGVVVAGRTPSEEADARRLRSERRNEIEFYTYDDLLKGVTGVIRQVSNA